MPDEIPDETSPDIPDETPLDKYAGSRGAGSRARAGIHAWIARAGGGLLHAAPHAIVMAMTSAALAPILLPLLSGAAGSAIADGVLVQLGHLGTHRLAELIEDIVERLRGEARVATVSEETVQNVLERRLEEEIAGAHGSELRTEITQLLRAVDGVGTTLDAAFRSEVEGLDAHIGQSLRVLSETVTEFRTLRDDVLWGLAAIQRDITRALILQQDQSDKLDRVNTQLALLRRELVFDRSARRGNVAAPSGAQSPAASKDDVFPYPGLAAFNVTDAFWFHGRERLIATMVNRLRERLHGSSPLMVVGASGAGKSSVLRAGLIPELDTGGLAEPGSQDWPREIMTPGQFPLRDLAIRLATLAELPASVVLDELSADPGRTPLIIRQALLTRGERRRHGVVTITPSLRGGRGAADETRTMRRLVLVIDQFEEIFTQCHDGIERLLFVDAMCAAAHGTRDDPPAALVVIGLGAGFIEHCTAHPELEPALRDQLIVGPMNGQELHAAIQLPARDAGLTVEEGLAATMLSDLGAVVSQDADAFATYDPGTLPLLAHALRETWERRADGRLTITAYADAGGIKQAVAKKADEVYDAFDSDGKRVARQLLLHMVAVREGTEETRRRMRRDALLAELPTANVETAERVLDRLEKERLVTADQDTVQIAHEALLRYWPLLSGWLEENRAWLRVQQRLTDHAHEWDDHDRHPDRLLHGTQLSAVHGQLDAARRNELGKLEAAFLHASERLQARTERARRAFVAVLAVAVVVAAGFAFAAQANSRAARRQQAIAQSQRAIAQSRQLAAEADTLRASDPEISLLLSLEAYRLDHTDEAVSSLLAAQPGYFTTHLDSRSGPVNAVAYDPMHGLLATAGQSGTVTLSDAATEKLVATLHGSSPFYAVAFDPGGRVLAGAEQDGTIMLWDAYSYRPIRAVTRDHDAVNAVVFSPDGRMLASAGDDGTVTLWRAGSQTVIRKLSAGDGPISGLAFSRDGALAAACADGAVRLWDRPAHSPGSRLLSGHAGPARAVAFSPAGTLLASGGDDGTVRLWDSRSGTAQGVLTGGTAQVRTVAFSPDGVQLASGGEDNAVRLWDVSTQSQIDALTGPTNTVSDVAFSPDGHTLASASADATVGIWNIAAPPQRGPPAFDAVASAGPPRDLLATASADSRITLWQLPQRHRVVTLNGAAGQRDAGTPLNDREAAFGMAFSPDGATLAAPAAPGNAFGIDLWNVTGQRGMGTLPAAAPVKVVAYRPRARSGDPDVIAGGTNTTVYLWTLPGMKATPVTGQLRSVNAVTFSTDGRLLATASDDGTILLDRIAIVGGRATASVLTQVSGHLGPVEAVAFSPDGRTLASGSTDDRVRLWDVSNPAIPIPIAVLRGHAQAVVSVAFSSDGGTLATSSDDHTIRVWNVRHPGNPALLAILAGLRDVTSVTFGSNGHTVIGAADDGTALFWDTDVSKVADRICATDPTDVADALTPYLLGVTYRPICPAAR